jgi:hypothetical protein
MIGLGWVMMYNSIVEKYVDNKYIDNKYIDNKYVDNKNEMKKINNTNNIILVNKI